ncbi:MAG: MFS transporter [Terricaulis sp.]
MFAIANAGAFIGCLPLLTILLPLKAAAIDAAEKTALLSWTVFWGALTASAVNIVAGALSDRTKSTLGRRKPWIICGALAAAASYAVIARAESAAALLIGVVLFQAAFNLFMPALAALLPDRIPDRRKGAMAAFPRARSAHWIGAWRRDRRRCLAQLGQPLCNRRRCLSGGCRAAGFVLARAA